MKYYVVADVHGFFEPLKFALEEKGFFKDKEPHKLIVCGDLMDRGEESLKLQDFIMDLINKDEVILIRGNHEDLMMELLRDWSKRSYTFHHHKSNGTVDTVLDLTSTNKKDLFYNPLYVLDKMYNTPFITKIIPSMINYYETKNYIFVHGWIPVIRDILGYYSYLDDWRNASNANWNLSRWVNGMELWHEGIKEKGKTIICGHWNCSYGHYHFEKKGSEYGNDAIFTPFYGDGIIAIDACTALSQKVNCIVLNDEEL